jgi:glyoxylase-like metal-dependent hydrolase (beta-lactamase superfamily II)
MHQALQFTPRTVAPDTEFLGAYLPVPGYGVLPVNAFLIRAAQPVLVDTGLAALRREFQGNLRSLIDPEDLRWIWITHADVDHLGSLAAVLAQAPRARVVTTYIGMAKMSLQQLPIDRVYLLNPGQRLDIGDRQLLALRPPTFDAPETTGLFDTRTRALFSADSFGALIAEPVEDTADLSPTDLRDGQMTWATIDAPWLQFVDQRKFAASVNNVGRLDPSVILSAHLPPARGMTQTLCENLIAAREAPGFEGPDQAALEDMLVAASENSERAATASART